MKKLINDIKQWGIDRGIDKCDPLLQTTKTLEECMELQRAIIRYGDIKNKYPNNVQLEDGRGSLVNSDDLQQIYKLEIKDAIGDIFITLVMLDLQVKPLDIVKVWTDNKLRHHDVHDYGFTSLNHSSYIVKEISTYQLIQNVCKHSGAEEIGGIIVHLSLIAQHYNLTLKECIEHAYNEIKDRKGHIVDGLWGKERINK